MRWDLSRLTCTLLRMRSLAGRPGSCTSLVSSSVMEEMSRRTKLPIEKGVYVPVAKSWRSTRASRDRVHAVRSSINPCADRNSFSSASRWA
jgi:hypothetical protein